MNCTLWCNSFSDVGLRTPERDQNNGFQYTLRTVIAFPAAEPTSMTTPKACSHEVFEALVKKRSCGMLFDSGFVHQLTCSALGLIDLSQNPIVDTIWPSRLGMRGARQDLSQQHELAQEIEALAEWELHLDGRGCTSCLRRTKHLWGLRFARRGDVPLVWNMN